MLKFKTVTKTVEELEDVICNICGKPCIDSCDMNYEYVTVAGSFGYCSGHDTEEVRAHICVACYDKHLVPLFTIDPVVEDVFI
jgi:hypothetical protein